MFYSGSQHTLCMHTKSKTLMYLWVGGWIVSTSIEKNVSKHCSEEPRFINVLKVMFGHHRATSVRALGVVSRSPIF